MTMKIGVSDLTYCAPLLQKATKSTIESLSPKEREAAYKIMSALKNGQSFAEINIDREELQVLKAKLEGKPLAKENRPTTEKKTEGVVDQLMKLGGLLKEKPIKEIPVETILSEQAEIKFITRDPGREHDIFKLNNTYNQNQTKIKELETSKDPEAAKKIGELKDANQKIASQLARYGRSKSKG